MSGTALGAGWGDPPGQGRRHERPHVCNPLLCPQLFGDVCYTCSHVIEGDGEAPSLCPLPAPAPIPCTLWACGPCSCVPGWPPLCTGGPVADLWGH